MTPVASLERSRQTTSSLRHDRAVHLEGGLFGPDLLEQLASGDVPGQKPTDFGLSRQANLLDEIAQAYRDACDLWQVFRRRLERLPANKSSTTLTREGWVIPFLNLLGYELRYNQKPYDVNGVTYAISHRAGESEDAPPVHITGAEQQLGRINPHDPRRLSPHALLQEFLNRTDHLWGIVTNGLTLRLLRDSTYVRRQAYVEFDLRAIFEAEGDSGFADFALLYRLLHRTRLPRGTADAHTCWLEQYHQQAIEQGNRARDRLRDGVEECLQILGRGFLHANPDWHPDPKDFYEQLLRLVYRFLFLLVAEERNLLGGSDLYRNHYSVSRFRRLIDRREAYTDHEDLWQSLRVLFYLLRNDTPQNDGKPLASLLDLPVLDGGLFEPIELDERTLINRDLLDAFFHLAYYWDDDAHTYRRVNYAALDVEELGSVYESLLDHHPVISHRNFEFASGTERKSTGSYYTPPELVAQLLHSALEPVIEERLAEAKQLAKSEWRIVSSEWKSFPSLVLERMYDHLQRLPRPGSVAARSGDRKTSLPAHADIPAIGTLRDNQPDTPSSDFDTGQHRGGLGTPLSGRVYPVPPSGERQPHRTGDTSDHLLGNRTGQGGGYSAHPGCPDRPRSSDPQPGAKPPTEEELKSLWANLPFAIRYSLLGEHAILSIRVLDPACGSGHFLLAAARRLGKELARARTGEDEPAPEQVREAIRDVVAHCIYGVDKNPLAVELCKVALWIESQVPGKPLTFLDHRIRCGDSLVGVFGLEVLQGGIPDEAFDPVGDEDKALAREMKKNNRITRSEIETGQPLLFGLGPSGDLTTLAEHARLIENIPDDSLEAIREKGRRYNELQAEMTRPRTACDLWTAAFFQRRTRSLARDARITSQTLCDWLRHGTAPHQALAQAKALAHDHRFFHWPIEFPEVFANGGFDVVLSNPPWERIKLQEEEFFAARDPEIARATTAAARKRLIARLKETNPALWQQYQEALHDADATSKFLRTGGRYSLTGRGDINTYSVFAELAAKLIRQRGRAGLVVPTGIATDATNQHFFRHLVESGRLVSLYDFENRKGIFPGVHRSYKFCLLTLRGERASSEWRVASSEREQPLAEFAFFCQEAADLRAPERCFTLSPQDFRLLNPNTGTAPIFRSRRDAELTKHIYRRVPVLIHERIAKSEWRMEEGGSEPFAIRHSPFAESNPWGVEFLRMFDMANDSHLFRTREELEAEGFRLEGNVFVKGDPHSPSAIRYSPLYEAKMIHQFDHRFGDYRDLPKGSKSTQLPEVPLERLADPTYQVLPRYWVPAEEVEVRLRAKGWDRGWLLGWRDITNVTNERTVIAAVIPRVGVGNKIPLIVSRQASPHHPMLTAVLSSLPLDYAARQKVGGTTLNFFIFEQLPVLPPSVFDQPLPFAWEDHSPFAIRHSPPMDHSPFAIRHSPPMDHSPFAIRHSPTIADWLRPRVLELTYTAWDLKPFAEDLWESTDDAGRQAILRQWEENHGTTADHSPFAIRHSPFSLPPFRYDPERRFQLRCELDALFFLLYLGTPEEWEREASPELKALFPTPRDAVSYILEQFPIVRRKDEERYGTYRTKDVILQCYDAMLRGMR